MAEIAPKTRARAEADTAKKDKKERDFHSSINAWHNKILLLFFGLLQENSIAVQIPTDLVTDLAHRLTDHYFDTATVFAGFPVRTEITQVESEPDKVRRNIQFAIDSVIQSNAGTRATQIAGTTSKFMARAMVEARAILGEELSTIAFARTATNILRAFLLARVGTIAMTETQYISETTRNIQDSNTRVPISDGLQRWEEGEDDGFSEEEREDMEEFGELSPSIAAGDIDAGMDVASAGLILAAFQKNQKQWLTMGDKKVRTSHVFANNQTVQINQPFVMGSGAVLMYPGDSSLGAPLGDVINCRCYAAYL